MSDEDTTTGNEVAKRLDEVSPAAQAALLLHMLENNSAGLDDVLKNRQWTGGNSSKSGHGSGFPIAPGDNDS